jgi:hypothetical protein
MIFSSKTGQSVICQPSIDINKDNKMDFDNPQDCMDQDISAEELPTAESGRIAHFLTDMPDLMNMTPEDLNLALESLSIPLEGPI